MCSSDLTASHALNNLFELSGVTNALITHNVGSWGGDGIEIWNYDVGTEIAYNKIYHVSSADFTTIGPQEAGVWVNNDVGNDATNIHDNLFVDCFKGIQIKDGSATIYNNSVLAARYLGLYLINTEGVSDLPISAGGSAYTTATVTVADPINKSQGHTRVTATATATITSGVITGITITDAGKGYASAPTWTLTGDGTGFVGGTAVLIPSNVVARNNYISMTPDGVSLYPRVVYGNEVALADVDYQLYNWTAPGTGTNAYRWQLVTEGGDTVAADVAAWQALLPALDVNSAFGDASLDGNYIPALSSIANSAGVATWSLGAPIPVDINGQLHRPTPVIGCAETLYPFVHAQIKLAP